jgi:hypothetical protein
MYAIRRVDNNTYDVFIGNQWATHSRVRKGRSSAWVVSGEKLGHAILREFHSILHPSMPINYTQSHDTTLDNCRLLAGNRQ